MLKVYSQPVCPSNKDREIIIIATVTIADKGEQNTFHELSLNEAEELNTALSKTVKEIKAAMQYFIIPINESTGIKELRVSRKQYLLSADGPPSGIMYKNRPIEEALFSTAKEARNTIWKVASWLAV